MCILNILNIFRLLLIFLLLHKQFSSVIFVLLFFIVFLATYINFIQFKQHRAPQSPTSRNWVWGVGFFVRMWKLIVSFLFCSVDIWRVCVLRKSSSTAAATAQAVLVKVRYFWFLVRLNYICVFAVSVLLVSKNNLLKWVLFKITGPA